MMLTQNIDDVSEIQAPELRPTTNSRRRCRPPVSCLPCRRRKVKCDRQSPCSQCDRLGRATRCVYSEQRNRNFEIYSKPACSPPNSTTEPILTRERPPAAEAVTNDLVSPTHIPASDSISLLTVNLHDSHSPLNPVLLSVMSQPAENSQLWHLPDYSYGGRSHWSWLLPRFSGLLQYVDQAGYYDNHRNHILYKDAKSKMKQSQSFTPYDPVDLSAMLSEMPRRDSIDVFAELYLGTFERLWRILHIPSFFNQLAKVWQHPGGVSADFATQLVLIILIGNSLSTAGGEKLPFEMTQRFWNTVLSWRSAATLFQNPDIQSIQTDALMLLTKRIYRFETPFSAITSNNLIHNAMLLGMHRDPSVFNRFSTAEMELRRRLWYTVLEIDILLSIDSGMPPSLEQGTWDTLYPSAIQDDELNVVCVDLAANVSSSGRRATAAGLAALARSTSLRLKIVKAVNQINFSLSYEDAIKFGTELKGKQESFHDYLSNFDFSGATKEINRVLFDLGDLLFERMIFVLHKPFAIEFSLHYEFSEYTCLKTALSMLEKLCSIPQDGYEKGAGNLRTGSLSSLTDVGGFFFESDALNAALLLSLFAIRDAKSTGLGPTLAGPFTGSACARQLQHFIHAARRRLLLPYPSGKAFIIASMALEYVALVNSNEADDLELSAKLQTAGHQIAKTALTLFLKQPGSITSHVTDAEAIVESTSFLF